MTNDFDFHRQIPSLEPVDVVVCGGGPSGFPAAVAAARAGLRVMLVESGNQLGGVGTSAGISHLLGGRSRDNRHWAVAGIFREVVEDLADAGGAIHPAEIEGSDDAYSPFGWVRGRHSTLAYGVPFDTNQMVALLDRKALDAGIDVTFGTSVTDVVVSDQRVTGVVINSKSGLQHLPCRAVVDATGDADVAAKSGCDVVKGREGDQAMTPATLAFHVGHVDQDALARYIEESGENRFRELIGSLREQGVWKFPYDVFISAQSTEPGTLMINTTRICDVDGTDRRSITRGLMQGRAEINELFPLMKQHFPGFADARIRSVAPSLGIRETRRIVADYVYRVTDLIDARDFDDTIAFSAYGWDLPDPRKPSYQPLHDRKTQMTRPYTPIPYRIMVPRPVGNVVCPGRSVSVERDVLGPLRVMGPCYGMGHAAGLAAVQVARRDCRFSEVDTDSLRRDLREAGAVVDWPS